MKLFTRLIPILEYIELDVKYFVDENEAIKKQAQRFNIGKTFLKQQYYKWKADKKKLKESNR